MARNRIVVFATAWGPKHGGINAFNTSFCAALAKTIIDTHELICIVPSATAEEITKAAAQDVVLVGATSGAGDEFGPEVIEATWKLAELKRASWFVGHDTISGAVANAAARRSKGRSAVIHHMNYSAYLAFKKKKPAELSEMIEMQREVLTEADVLFAVGPKLLESARALLPQSKRSSVVELIPGLPKVQAWGATGVFTAIAYGRLHDSNNLLKQGHLAAAAFGRARSSLGNDARLTLIGIEDTQLAPLQKIAEKEAGRVVTLNGFPFLNDSEKILDALRTHSVCIVPSLHEGFGLAGWEAISAQVPLILSKNSGLYELIDRTLEGAGKGLIQAVDIKGASDGYNSEDADAVANAIRYVQANQERAQKDARKLKLFLEPWFTWESTANDFTIAIGIKSGPPPAQRRVEQLLEKLALPYISIEQAIKRTTLVEQTLAKVESGEYRRHLILFGGIAAALCNETSARLYAAWLKKNKGAHLFICFETGKAMQSRAALLDSSKLKTQPGLTDVRARLTQKERSARSLRAKIIEYGGSGIASRVISTPLAKPLTTYVIVADDDVILTPLSEKRSSETLSFAYSHSAKHARQDILDTMDHYLKTFCATSSEAKKLGRYLARRFSIALTT